VELSAEDLQPSQFQGYDYFHIEGYLVQNHELLKKAVSLAKENDLKVSIDMASYNVVEENKTFLGPIIHDYVDIIFANEEEAKAFTGLEPASALDKLAEICDIAVVKIGEAGSLIKQGENKYEIGIIEARSVDTTGAGDLYAAGFLYGLTEQYPLDKCGMMGTLLAGNIIEVIGAKMDKERWSNIINAINSNN